MYELESGGTVVSWDNFEQMGTWKGKRFMIVLTYSVQRMEYFYYFQGTFVTLLYSDDTPEMMVVMGLSFCPDT